LNQLIRLVYASRSAVQPTTHQGVDPGIARILAKSRKNNARLDVVGGLLFGEGYFLQCLEGDARIVQNLYSKIEADTRHRDVTVLLQSSINMRTFGAWSMKYVPGEQRLQGLLRQWGETTFNPLRDEEDAVDTVPSELQPLAGEPDPVVQPPRRASPREAKPRGASRTQPAAAPGSTSFVKVVAGVALICLSALAFTLLR